MPLDFVSRDYSRFEVGSTHISDDGTQINQFWANFQYSSGSTSRTIVSSALYDDSSPTASEVCEDGIVFAAYEGGDPHYMTYSGHWYGKYKYACTEH